MQIILTVTDGPHRGQVFTFAGHDTFIVGRSKYAHFQLRSKDKYFSRVHFLLEVNPPHCRLVDMNSRNGTYVNGQRVTVADLSDGDTIKAGHTVLRLDVGAEATALPAPAAPPTVTLASDGAPQIPGFEMRRELGRGGMGVVWLARRHADGALVALKTVTPAVAASPRQLQRFFREANILQQLTHPGIVRCLDLGEASGVLYFVMEYVEGTDAARLLQRCGPLAAGRAVNLTCQLLNALQYAHAQGYVHRDVKPANLLIADVGAREEVKLADFGLARVYQASELSGLTMTGEVGGTAGFMPPEQITHYREARPAADQYAAAATLYNLLTARFPHDLPRELHLQFSAILHEDPVPLRTRRPELPEELGRIIHRALAREPEGRYPDVAALRSALLTFAG